MEGQWFSHVASFECFSEYLLYLFAPVFMETIRININILTIGRTTVQRLTGKLYYDFLTLVLIPASLKRHVHAFYKIL